MAKPVMYPRFAVNPDQTQIALWLYKAKIRLINFSKAHDRLDIKDLVDVKVEERDISMMSYLSQGTLAVKYVDKAASCLKLYELTNRTICEARNN
jgi:hypothetical protein